MEEVRRDDEMCLEVTKVIKASELQLWIWWREISAREEVRTAARRRAEFTAKPRRRVWRENNKQTGSELEGERYGGNKNKFDEQNEWKVNNYLNSD